MKMSRSVFYRNRTRPVKAENIMTKLNDDQNPDMKVNFKGYMHGGKGFALEVLNLENITEATMNLWKNIIDGQGLNSSIVTDMMGGKVNIQCTPEKRQKRRSYLNSFVYLSLTLGFIYTLWTRHHHPF